MAKYLRNRLLVKKEIKCQLEYNHSEPIIIRSKGLGIFQSGEIHTDNLNIYEMNGDIWINGHQIYGWIEEKYRCDKCNNNLIYDADHNSQFCPECNSWVNQTCSNNLYSCSCCSTRKLKPLPDGISIPRFVFGD
jgi:hypothetical protein